MEIAAKFEKGKYYRRDHFYSGREGQYFQVMDISHPDESCLEHTVYDLFEITFKKFDACRVNWGEEPAKYIFGPSRHWHASRTSTLQHLSEGFIEVSPEEFEAVRSEFLKEMSEADSIPGVLIENPNLWWGEKYYVKLLDAPTFSTYVPPTQSFQDVSEIFTLKFGEWGTDICGVRLIRGYSSSDEDYSSESYIPLDDSLFKQRRDALMKMIRENIECKLNTGHYDFVPNPYKKEVSE